MEKKEITPKLIIQRIKEHKKLFSITLAVTFVLSCILILCVPRSYSSSIMLAPEINADPGGTIGSIAANFGIDINDMQTTDAITPLLYPDLADDNRFICSLFNVKVKSADGTVNCTYYEYLLNHQKHAWWSSIFKWFNKLIKSIMPAEKDFGGKQEESTFNPYWLNKEQHTIAGLIRNSISIHTDKKTGVSLVAAEAQDPLICKTIADSTCAHLQDFITDYRTSKARNDVEYYGKLTEEAKEDYEKARHRYVDFADSNIGPVLERYRSKQTDLENDMQLKYNNYTTLNTQLLAAKAKVQEKTPAFAVLEGAAVPQRASKPKRMVFVMMMCFLAFGACLLWTLRDEVKQQLNL